MYGAGTGTFFTVSVFRIRIVLSDDTVPDPAITLARIQIRIRIQLITMQEVNLPFPLHVHFPNKMIPVPAGSHVHTFQPVLRIRIGSGLSQVSGSGFKIRTGARR